MHPVSKIAILAGAACGAQPLMAANIIPGNVTGINVTGTPGVLRAGSPWGPGSTPSDANTPADGLFVPEQQQWNNGSFWWDHDSSVNQGPVYWEVQLDQAYTVDRFVVQADDNDRYLVEYWDGGAWLSAYTVPFQFSFGLVTRDSGIGARITTDRFRLSAIDGDNYFAVSEFQAFAAVPEPATWAMLILGMGVVGGAMRRRTRTRYAFV